MSDLMTDRKRYSVNIIKRKFVRSTSAPLDYVNRENYYKRCYKIHGCVRQSNLFFNRRRESSIGMCVYLQRINKKQRWWIVKVGDKIIFYDSRAAPFKVMEDVRLTYSISYKNSIKVDRFIRIYK